MPDHTKFFGLTRSSPGSPICTNIEMATSSHDLDRDLVVLQKCLSTKWRIRNENV